MLRTGRPLLAIGAALCLLAVACSSTDEDDGSTGPSTTSPPTSEDGPTDTRTEPSSEPTPPPRNPFLADSVYSIGHTDSAQQDSTSVPGPTGPTTTLDEEAIDYQQLGPGHFSLHISSPYDDGRRAIWTNGADRIVKLDHDTFEVIDELAIPGKRQWTDEEAEASIEQFETLEGDDRTPVALNLAVELFEDLSGVYALLDVDGDFYVGGGREVSVYTDASAGDPDSEITAARRYELPDEVTGPLVGMNLTFDGRLILVTEHGWVVAVDRDFAEEQVVKMADSEEAQAYSEQKEAENQTGRGWIRNGYAIDEDGGIYIAANDSMHKVVWTGTELSIEETDGAWTAPISNSRGIGTGATPSLMGFGDEDRFVVVTDGDDLMNVVLYWRDDVPEDWEPIPGAPSPRIAGSVPADMGDPDRESIQTEQSVVVAGYGALVVDNEPASIPDDFPGGRATVMLSSFLGADPRFTPHGLQKFEWDPAAEELGEAWVNSEVASPNAVPYVSLGSDMAYTVGVRDGQWTVEGVDWDTGESAFHWIVGGERYNSLFSGLILDEEGRVIYGTTWGKVRIDLPAAD